MKYNVNNEKRNNPISRPPKLSEISYLEQVRALNVDGKPVDLHEHIAYNHKNSLAKNRGGFATFPSNMDSVYRVNRLEMLQK